MVACYVDCVYSVIFENILLFHIRHRADAEANASIAYKFDQSTKRIINSTWAELAIGDIILVKSRSTIPADIVILGVSEKSSIKTGICYVETKSLDGETNLKVRNAMPVTMKEVQILPICGIISLGQSLRNYFVYFILPYSLNLR